ncbi:hypothetical protein [Streptomyces sp. NPDC055036]
MPFEIFSPESDQPQRRQRPAKLTVSHAENGRSQISLSARTRDWLRPTPGNPSARYPGNMPTMKLIVLIDQEARKLMLQRCADDDTGSHVYDVRGMRGSGTGYITGWGFDEELGIKAGHYLCELSHHASTSTDSAERAVIISMDARVPPKKRQPRPDPAIEQAVASPGSSEDH